MISLFSVMGCVIYLGYLVAQQRSRIDKLFGAIDHIKMAEKSIVEILDNIAKEIQKQHELNDLLTEDLNKRNRPTRAASEG